MNKIEPIIVEHTYNASVKTVWSAITVLDQMKKWFFENIESFEPKPGFETKFNVQSESRDFMHLWKITEVDPLKKIVYNWRYEGIIGDSYVAFELFEQKNKTKLRLTATGLETFPKNIPEFTRDSCIGGWNYFIKNRLSEYIKNESLQ